MEESQPTSIESVDSSPRDVTTLNPLSIQDVTDMFVNFHKTEIPPTEPVERINPEDCKLLEPPRVFLGSKEAQVFFEQIPEEAEIIVLPYMMEGATLHNKISLNEVMAHYRNGTDVTGYDRSTYPIAVSLITTNGKKRYAVLLSETPNVSVQPPDESRRYYRDNDVSSIAAIKESGFLQLPGRYFLRGNIEHTGQLPAKERAIISFDLPNQYMITNDPTDLRTVAVGFHHPSLGAQLPAELQRELWLFDGRENQVHSIRYKDQEQQVLPWGAVSGMLVKLDATNMQVEKTHQPY